MHYLYIIYSKRRDRYYSGQTKDVHNRLIKHNKGHSVATMSGLPWELRKVIEFETKTDAIKAELWLKRMKSRTVVERILEGEIGLKQVMKN